MAFEPDEKHSNRDEARISADFIICHLSNLETGYHPDLNLATCIDGRSTFDG